MCIPCDRNSRQCQGFKIYLPRSVQKGDTIFIRGSLKTAKSSFKISLVTIKEDAACHISVDLRPEENSIKVGRIIDNKEDTYPVCSGTELDVEKGVSDTDRGKATDLCELVGNQPSFEIRFEMKDDEKVLISSGSNPLAYVTLKHSLDIVRYLSVNGDLNINEIEFGFREVFHNRGETDGPYGARLSNGDTQRAPLPDWPLPTYDNEIMFLLPRTLRVGDEITVKGHLKDGPSSLMVNLVTGGYNIDYNNIACQVAFNFDSDSYAVNIIRNGQNKDYTDNSENLVASELISISEPFEFGFRINVNPSSSEGFVSLDIMIGSSFLQSLTLEHSVDSIRYLTFSGDVDRVDNLDFRFA